MLTRPNPVVSIIILNWNGWQDTIECLQSLRKINYQSYKIIIVDNGSEDESLKKLEEHIQKEWHSLEHSTPDGEFKNEITLIKNSENFGFAKGNNIGICYAEKSRSDYVLLLNNDTIVGENFLQHLIDFKIKNPSYLALSPQIRHYHDKNKIWNCGGKIYSFGIRKYYYYGRSVENLPQNKFLDISFITGCALFLDYKKTGLLTEKYFFGEEDFEFSMRMKKNGFKMACVLDSVIFHKIGSSVNTITQQSRLGIIYIYYLNRFVNMRSFMNKYLWNLWRWMYLGYIFYLLKRKQYSFLKIISMAKVLMKNSMLLSEVTKEHFRNATEGNLFKI